MSAQVAVLEAAKVDSNLVTLVRALAAESVVPAASLSNVELVPVPSPIQVVDFDPKKIALNLWHIV